MEHEFWHERWETGQTAFHEGRTNHLLERHFDKLELSSGDAVFVPLCGRAHDIHWLMAQGLEVVGAELSDLAIEQLFVDVGATPTITNVGPLKVYETAQLKVFVGDIFDVTPELLGPVKAIYDRAALVALPEEIRARYAAHLVSLTKAARQLTITFDYDQSVIPGPPFSVPEATVNALYGEAYTITLLDQIEVEGGLKGKVQAAELAWLLS